MLFLSSDLFLLKKKKASRVPNSLDPDLLLIFFPFFLYKNKSFRVPNSLDPDQARHFVRPDLGLVGPDLDPSCLQRRQTTKITTGRQS